MTKGHAYKVRDVSRMSGVSVRALHHYDALGLLTPSARSEAGYRLYSDADLLRLQQILIGREFGLSLQAIKQSLDDPGFDVRAALEAQRHELEARVARSSAMLDAINAALAALTHEDETIMSEMTPDERARLFGGFDPSAHEEEVQQRWGATEAYRESARRTARYGKDDWARYRAESEALMAEAAQLFLAGASADADEALSVAERHRASIERWFYPCPPELHVGLADLYEADPRFAASIDAAAPGLTPWLAEAIRANARASGQ